jgi:hypothetical protein
MKVGIVGVVIGVGDIIIKGCRDRGPKVGKQPLGSMSVNQFGERLQFVLVPAFRQPLHDMLDIDVQAAQGADSGEDGFDLGKGLIDMIRLDGVMATINAPLDSRCQRAGVLPARDRCFDLFGRAVVQNVAASAHAAFAHA